LTGQTQSGDRTRLAWSFIMQALSIAAAGMTSAQMRFDDSARRTATAPLDNLAEETVERLQAKTAFSANAAVVRTADEMTATLLDILA
jgi:flagellar basal body rod protein FlgC